MLKMQTTAHQPLTKADFRILRFSFRVFSCVSWADVAAGLRAYARFSFPEGGF